MKQKEIVIQIYVLQNQINCKLVNEATLDKHTNCGHQHDISAVNTLAAT